MFCIISSRRITLKNGKKHETSIIFTNLLMETSLKLTLLAIS